MVETISIGEYGADPTMSAPEKVYRTTYDVFREMGYSVSENMHTPPEGSDIPEGVGITPRPIVVEKSNELGYTGRNQVALFKLKDTLDNRFDGHHSDADSVTALHVQAENSIRATLEQLNDQGLIDDFVSDVFDELKPTYNPTEEQLKLAKQDAIDIAAYTTGTFAKGWLAETILAQSDRFEKGSPSDDAAGKDLYDRSLDDWVQLKHVSNGYRSNVTDRNGGDLKFIYYQWNCDGGIVTGEDHTRVNAEANIRGLSRTLMARTHGEYKFEDENGELRTYRYLWW
jgi:hypothetical protein